MALTKRTSTPKRKEDFLEEAPGEPEAETSLSCKGGSGVTTPKLAVLPVALGQGPSGVSAACVIDAAIRSAEETAS